jgi:hypothetical protein
MSLRSRERLAGVTYPWSVERPLNDQCPARPLVTAADETVFMWNGRSEVWGRPSDIGAVARPPGTRLARLSNRAAAVRGDRGGWPHGATPAKEET